MTKAFERKRCGMEKQYVRNLEGKIQISIQHLPSFPNTKSLGFGTLVHGKQFHALKLGEAG